MGAKTIHNDENRTKIEQIESILGLDQSKTVVSKIKIRIAELKNDFNESIQDEHYELLELTGLEAEELEYDKDPDRTELFENFKDTQYSIEYYEVESFMTALDEYFHGRYRVYCDVRDLEDLLK
jgi:hypothetical protein